MLIISFYDIIFLKINCEKYKDYNEEVLLKYKKKEGVNLIKLDKEKLGEKVGNFANDAKKITENISDKTKEIVSKSKEKVVTTMDANGDGHIDIEDVIIMGLRTPGVKISRSEFLSKELMKKYPEAVIEKAIETTPANAGISAEEINVIADNVIQYERNCVTGISAALGTPGGASMVATLPADIIQYYGYMLRATQKLMYLYGFPEIDVEEKGQTFDSETLNILIICFGVMYGVAGANNAVKAMAKGLAKGISKKIMSTALTKGTLYPIVKSIAKWFGVKMTKKLLAGMVQKTIPVIGGVVGGGITYVSFKPCCDKLKESLQDTWLSNPNHIETEEENIIIDSADYSIHEEE